MSAAHAEQPVSRIVRVTHREREVLDAFMLDGAANETIARRLEVTIDTVKTHIKNLLRAFDVPTRTALALEVERGHCQVIVSWSARRDRMQ